MGLNLSLGCIQTPATGNEQIFPTIPVPTRNGAQHSKRPTVMIVGGGPAGMQAAKVAAQRGFRVKLYEKSHELGGQINLLTRVPSRVEFGDASRNLQREIGEAGVEVHLDTEVTAERIEQEKPDAVILATGSLPLLPQVPGTDLPHVATVWQFLQGEKQVQPGNFVLVYDQMGFHQATSVAELLAEKGCNVEIVTPQFYVGGDLSITLDIELWYRRALAKGIRLTPNHFLAGLGPNNATIMNNYTGQTRQIENIALAVMATPQSANDTLYHQLLGKIQQLYRIGDCMAPRRVEHAILDGERAARALTLTPTKASFAVAVHG